MSDEISDLRLFTRLVAAGNLSEAARRLDSSPPAMSRRLAAMEARLGVRLVDRSSRRFALTEEGAILYDRALRILAEVDDAEAEATAGGKVPRGRLRIGAPTQMGRQEIAPLLAQFVQLFPKVHVELVLTDAEPDLVENEFDIAFSVGLPRDTSHIARRLVASHHLVVCASPDYFAARGLPATPEDLLKHNCIVLVRGRQVFDRWNFIDSGHRREVHVRGNLSSTSSELVHGWVLMGLGIASRLHWAIREDLEAGRLVECLAPYAYDERALYMVYASRAHVPPRLRAFIDFAVARIGEDGHATWAKAQSGGSTMRENR